MPEINNKDLQEIRNPELDNFRNIMPEQGMTMDTAKEFWNKEFGKKSETDNPEKNLETILKEYFDDLRKNSEFPETLPEKPFDIADLKLRSPEENSEMREEFDDKKADLKRQWEEIHGEQWPKYDHDIYSSNGKLIRKEGCDYDAHHIQPLGLGGKNEATNITPLSAENHYDKQGVHSPDSPYSRLEKRIGGNNNE